MSNFVGLEVPVGTVMPCVDFNFTNLGNAWLVCNGQLIDTSTYPELYNVIGSTYNVGGESSGYFRVPNCQDVIPKCETSSIGTSGGESNYTLSTAQMPQHYHSFTQYDHHHYFTYDTGIYGDDLNNYGGTGQSHRKTIRAGADAPSSRIDEVTHDTTGVSLNSGSYGDGNSFNAIPASKKVLYIIKT